MTVATGACGNHRAAQVQTPILLARREENSQSAQEGQVLAFMSRHLAFNTQSLTNDLAKERQTRREKPRATDAGPVVAISRYLVYLWWLR